MIREDEVVGTIRAALEREPRVNLHNHPIELSFADGVVTISGEVGGIAAKKIALTIAAKPSPVSGIVDRLRVEPSEPMEDGAIRDHVCNALTSEPAFLSYSVRALVKQAMEPVRSVQEERYFEVEVDNGVVVLNGVAESISHKRLAGVLSWWVPGSRDVVNGIDLFSNAEEQDEELVDLIRIVLEKDPLVNASQITVHSRDGVVTIEGTVPTPNNKRAAESDVWYVLGVNEVVNKLVLTGL
ncbi:phospholipid-binding domain protein, putative [Citrifermentans bemidjiense Bem]|uniref:Phospholipid-binding domain protein, putative n=1 Tax=Citrifermentans bemidjiense (strain ATCC BAA-1014 / DSM 16622 / JCM 12645 / Bem) TaxID=404380 RepID=B5EGE2_CITBB|nr:BON domain-containing protein [Citrifermentans bemidjiense]ACH38007.1 phospholipid-binding domain protein, putative [Citrifermentans bemidjiense Bem]